MALRFKNNYEREIWAMVERYQPNCSASSNWRKEGWWRIGPGETAVVYGGDAKAVNPIWYCYAYAGDGTEWRDTYQETVRTLSSSGVRTSRTRTRGRSSCASSP